MPEAKENTPAQEPVAFDEAKLMSALEKMIEAKFSGDGAGSRTAPQIAPPALGESNPELSVGRDRSVDGDGWKFQTFRLLQGVYTRNSKDIMDAQTKMARAGFYGDKAKQDVEKAERAVMLTSDEGQPFLPVQVLNVIEDVMKEYGVVRQDARVITFTSGTVKIPNISGRFEAFAVNEGSIIKARKPSFGSQTLDPDKWGVITPWSSETSQEVGAQLVEVIFRLAGEAFAKKEDETVLTADGTAAYHSLTGLLADATIGEYTLPATKTSFEDLTYNDLIGLRDQTAPSVRKRGNFYFHHDIESIFLKLVDGSGRYIFPPGTQTVERIVGRPVRYTEAMPGVAADAVSTPFGVYGDLSYVTMGFQQLLTASLLTEATIQDVDDATLIHLAAQDAQALRLIARWDVKRGLTDPFARITTPAA